MQFPPKSDLEILISMRFTVHFAGKADSCDIEILFCESDSRRISRDGTEMEKHSGDDPSTSDRLRAPRIFVCYAHESDAHKRTVRRFAEFLITQGINVEMDSWVHPERTDWQLWATSQIREADFVLVIASPTCRSVGDGEYAPQECRGLRAEMNLLRELYHGKPDIWPKRILPVVLAGYSIDDIPIFLQPHTVDHYKIEDLTLAGAEDLLRHLTRQRQHFPPLMGSVPLLGSGVKPAMGAILDGR